MECLDWFWFYENNNEVKVMHQQRIADYKTIEVSMKSGHEVMLASSGTFLSNPCYKVLIREKRSQLTKITGFEVFNIRPITTRYYNQYRITTILYLCFA